MVNANKHRALKIINEITEPERKYRQEANNRELYNKNKHLVNNSSNWGRRPEAKALEFRYGQSKGVWVWI